VIKGGETENRFGQPVIPLKDGVDEGGDGRTAGKDHQGAEKQQSQDNGQQPKFFPHLEEPPQILKKFMVKLLDINEVDGKPREGRVLNPPHTFFFLIRVRHIFPWTGPPAPRTPSPGLVSISSTAGIGPHNRRMIPMGVTTRKNTTVRITRDTTWLRRWERPNQSTARGRKALGQAMVRIAADGTGRNLGTCPNTQEQANQHHGHPRILACSGVDFSHQALGLAPFSFSVAMLLLYRDLYQFDILS